MIVAARLLALERRLFLVENIAVVYFYELVNSGINIMKGYQFVEYICLMDLILSLLLSRWIVG